MKKRGAGKLHAFFAAGGESPLTLRPNLKSEKGNVTAAAAACSPRRGVFVGGDSQGEKVSLEKEGEPAKLVEGYY